MSEKHRRLHLLPLLLFLPDGWSAHRSITQTRTSRRDRCCRFC